MAVSRCGEQRRCDAGPCCRIFPSHFRAKLLENRAKHRSCFRVRHDGISPGEHDEHNCERAAGALTYVKDSKISAGSWNFRIKDWPALMASNRNPDFFLTRFLHANRLPLRSKRSIESQKPCNAAIHRFSTGRHRRFRSQSPIRGAGSDCPRSRYAFFQ